MIGSNGYGPKWSWAEMVMGRNNPEPCDELVTANNEVLSF